MTWRTTYGSESASGSSLRSRIAHIILRYRTLLKGICVIASNRILVTAAVLAVLLCPFSGVSARTATPRESAVLAPLGMRECLKEAAGAEQPSDPTCEPAKAGFQVSDLDPRLATAGPGTEGYAATILWRTTKTSLRFVVIGSVGGGLDPCVFVSRRPKFRQLNVSKAALAEIEACFPEPACYKEGDSANLVGSIISAPWTDPQGRKLMATVFRSSEPVCFNGKTGIRLLTLVPDTPDTSWVTPTRDIELYGRIDYAASAYYSQNYALFGVLAVGNRAGGTTASSGGE